MPEIEICEVPNWETDYLNPNLRELKITLEGFVYYNHQLLTKLIAAYPNLQKLDVKVILKIGEPIASLKIRPILIGFPQLESLKIKVRHLIVQDLNYFQNHKDNLKFL